MVLYVLQNKQEMNHSNLIQTIPECRKIKEHLPFYESVTSLKLKVNIYKQKIQLLKTMCNLQLAKGNRNHKGKKLIKDM